MLRERLIGAYIQPPRLCGLGPPEPNAPGAARLIHEAAIAHGRRPVWEGKLDGFALYLTGAGGVFAQPPADDGPIHQASWERQRELAADLCNLVLCELTLQGVPCAPFTVADLCHAHREDDGNLAIWVATGHFAPSSFAIDSALRAGNSQVLAQVPVAPDRVAALADLPGARHLRDIAPALPAFLAHAYAASCHQRSADCVIYAWTVCEVLLDWLWETHVLSQASSSKRRKALSEGNRYTASVRSEMLWRLGILSVEVLDALDAARRARNQVAHRAQVDAEMTKHALGALNAMLRLEYESAAERAERATR